MSKKQNLIYNIGAIVVGLIVSFLLWAFFGTVNMLSYIRILLIFTLIHCLFFYISRKISFKKILFIPSVLLFVFSLLMIGQTFMNNSSNGFGEAIAFALGIISLFFSILSFLVSLILFRRIKNEMVFSTQFHAIVIYIVVILVVIIVFQYQQLLFSMSGTEVAGGYYVLVLAGSIIISVSSLFLWKKKYQWIKMWIILLPLLYCFIFSVETLNGITISLIFGISFLIYNVMKPNVINCS